MGTSREEEASELIDSNRSLSITEQWRPLINIVFHRTHRRERP